MAEIIEADRELVESGCEEMLDRAKEKHMLYHFVLWWPKFGVDVCGHEVSVSLHE